MNSHALEEKAVDGSALAVEEHLETGQRVGGSGGFLKKLRVEEHESLHGAGTGARLQDDGRDCMRDAGVT